MCICRHTCVHNLCLLVYTLVHVHVCVCLHVHVYIYIYLCIPMLVHEYVYVVEMSVRERVWVSRFVVALCLHGLIGRTMRAADAGVC